MFVFDKSIIDSLACNDLDFLIDIRISVNQIVPEVSNQVEDVGTHLRLLCTIVKHLAHVAVSGVPAPVREAATETPEWRPGSQCWSHHRPANTDTGLIHTIN